MEAFFFIVYQWESNVACHFQIYRIVLSMYIGLIRPGPTQTGCTKLTVQKTLYKSNQINFIGIKSSHRTVTSHMYTITQLHVQLQSQIDPYTNVFLYIYIYRLN